MHSSVKILQICMDLQDSEQRSLQNPAEKIRQICTDSQRPKTWVVCDWIIKLNGQSTFHKKNIQD